jgi:hypothetical protein
VGTQRKRGDGRYASFVELVAGLGDIMMSLKLIVSMRLTRTGTSHGEDITSFRVLRTSSECESPLNAGERVCFFAIISLLAQNFVIPMTKLYETSVHPFNAYISATHGRLLSRPATF